MRLGIIDWGIGGFGALRRLHERCPQLDILYFSDSGHVPYGRVPRVQLARRVEEVVNSLPVSHVLVACNAASVVLPDIPTSIPIEGMVRHGVNGVLATGLHRWAVIGGEGTVAAGTYGTLLREKGLMVTERSGQPLSAHVEAGRLAGEGVEKDVRMVLAPLKDTEGLLLACTHYPALTPLLQDALPTARIVDPVETLVPSLVKEWGLDAWQGSGSIEAQTTGDEGAMRDHARMAFGFRW